MFLGIDFGTSNSAVGFSDGANTGLVALEGEETTLPSALFFDTGKGQTLFGRAAIESYVQHEEGRLLRALKSILGSSLIEESTQVGKRKLPFKTIIALFLGHLKARAEAQFRTTITDVVLGRPVHYVDGKEDADRLAQTQMEEIARSCGFKNILFQYEPVAAALAYEQTISRETLALIVDIGGGTSDFSIVKAKPQGMRALDRREDILANAGVHVGGTDLDKRLCLHQLMPLFGYQTRLKGLFKGEEMKPLPESPFHDMATWHKIVLMYNHKTLSQMEEMQRRAEHPELLERFLELLHGQYGHRLMGDVEEAKIDLSSSPARDIALDYIERDLAAQVSQELFETSIHTETRRMQTSITACLKQAHIERHQIRAVFLTGGSTLIPAVERACLLDFPEAEIIRGDRFGSVGTGLALDAGRRFGG